MPRAGPILLVLLFVTASARFCPDGSLEYSQGNECIYAVDADTTYDVAQKTCREFGGRLVQPKSDTENAFVSSQKTQVLKNREVYIGVRRQDGVWKYGDGAPTSVGYDCGIMQGTNSYWTSSPCSTKRPFICTFSDHPCPDGWAYNEQTNYCYYTPMGLNWPGIYRNNVSFDLGEQYCDTQYGAHLVSIHSAAEDQFVKDLVDKSVADYSPGTCSGYYWLIGLKDGNWTDGTPLDYNNRDDGSPVFGIRDSNCNYPKWYGLQISHVFRTYICKKAVNVVSVDLLTKLDAVHEAAKLSRLTNKPFALPEFIAKP
ncbi:unnamed protein product, partial [Mesorhabditis spiculigera]